VCLKTWVKKLDVVKIRVGLWVLLKHIRGQSNRKSELKSKLGEKNCVVRLKFKDLDRQWAIQLRDSQIALASTNQEADVTVTLSSLTSLIQLVQQKDKMAFMKAIQAKELTVEGDMGLLLWFMGLAKHLMPNKTK
jgi:ubiquinone biosynthesis protein UbiJ